MSDAATGLSAGQNLENIHLLVVTPEMVIFDADVRSVQVPLIDGLLGVWPGHAPLIAALAPGELVVDIEGGGEERIAIPGGILRIDVERCVVLAGGLSSGAQNEAPPREGLVAELEDALEETLSAGEIEALQSG